jgi:hypothetical protein
MLSINLQMSDSLKQHQEFVLINQADGTLHTQTTKPFLYWKTPNPPETLQSLPHLYLAQSRSAKAGYS